jgi:hypothetical protein
MLYAGVPLVKGGKCNLTGKSRASSDAKRR